MKTIEFINGLQSGGRKPHLILIKNNDVWIFSGKSIPDVCTVIGGTYKPNGKWSSITYTVQLMDGVKSYEIISPLHGIWGEKYLSWGEVCEYFSLSVEKAKELVHKIYPKTAERLDMIERLQIEAEQQGVQDEIITFSFGNPKSYDYSHFWGSPREKVSESGKIIRISPDESMEPSPQAWDHPQCEGGSILDIKRSPGPHGGYVNIQVMVS